ncbi:glycosyltransferase [Flavobacteriaceae bacterium XHP0103]|uniref:glycosyltransferase n=1 Tax=Marixanthotalea marina TaxID=2844359 RepID=UPI002989CC88|nr:glycosyltransferase [Marixanthotalea marina]MBU3822287.1 glycosyltransferase [Marixanthotalea marina]
MKNITFLINNLFFSGGTQRVLTSLANLLVDRYRITILVFNDDKGPFFELNPEIKIKKIDSKKTFKIFRLIDSSAQIYNELKNSSCDYYISLDSNTVLLQSLFLPKKTKLIIWEHFSLSKNFNKVLFKISRYYASKRAYKFVLLSKQEIKDWGRVYNISKQKLALIYNPITINESLDILDADLYNNKKLLAIGNNVHVKGFDYLLQAWSLVSRNGWSLEFVGLPEQEQIKLKNIMANYTFENQIIVKGSISNIQKKYLEASIYCLCSRMEATPLVLIESQYVGLPAISFDNCEGPLELLNDSGLIVTFRDVNAYAKAINKLINSKNLYHELSKNAKLNSERFKNQVFCEKWRNLLS